MKRYWLFIIILLTVWVSGCKKEHEIIEEKCTDIKLIVNDTGLEFDKPIIISEDSGFLIKSPLNIFITDIKQFYSYDSVYFHLADSLLIEANKSDTLYLINYVNNELRKQILAGILESGDCFVLRENDSTALREVCIERYTCCCPLAGVGGRKFYLQGRLFMDIIDMIC